MDFHLNVLQDTLTILEHTANSTQARLAVAKAIIMCEIFITILCSFNLAFKILVISSLNFLDLSAQLESLRLAVEYAVGFVNTRGAVPVVRLHDVPNRVREVALRGIRHGTTIALAITQVHSGHELRLLHHGFQATNHPEDHEHLVNDFFNAACSIALSSLAGDIVNKVFSDP
jgi:hypothetical protein